MLTNGWLGPTPDPTPVDADSQGRFYIQGAVETDTTVTAAAYHVLDRWLIAPGVTLTLEPGVVLAFGTGASLDVQGTLSAIGTQANNITFTSAQQPPAVGDWLGIILRSPGSGHQIEYAVIEYAQYGIYTNSSSSSVILYSRITNNSYGVYHYGGSPDVVINYCEIFDNVAYNYYNLGHATIDAGFNWWGSNDPLIIAQGIYDYSDDLGRAAVMYIPFLDAVGGTPVDADSQGRFYIQGAVETDTTVTAAAYHVLDRWLIAPGVTLTLEPGVVLAFGTGASLDVQGTLSAIGTQANNITFTSAQQQPAVGDWLGIILRSPGSGHQIEYAVIEYAQYGIYTNSSSSSVILYSRITNNSYGVYHYGGSPDVVINYCEIFDNVAYNYYNLGHATIDAGFNWWGSNDPLIIAQGIYDYSDDLGRAAVMYIPFLDAVGGTPVDADSQGRFYIQGAVETDTTVTAAAYHVLDRWLIAPGVTLTLEPGVVLAFGTGASLDVQGTLSAIGTQANNITFTSAQQPPAVGDWLGIILRSPGSGHQIEYAVIEYAQYGIYTNSSSSSVILYSRITNNSYGVYHYGGSPDVVINYCEIFDNVAYNYYNLGHATIDAGFNWWGAETWEEIHATIWDYQDNAGLGRVDIDGFGFRFSPNGDGSKDSVVFVNDIESLVDIGNNLLTNPGAETGDISGWETSSGFDVRSSNPNPHAGSYYFFPGALTSSDLYQVVDLTLYYTSAELDSGDLEAAVGGYQRSYNQTPADEGFISVDFLDGSDQVIQTVSADSVAETAQWVLTDLRVLIPAQTRKIRYNFTATRYSADDLDAYLDSCFLYVYKAPVWTVTIRDENGQVVRIIEGKGIFQYIEWDGMDDLGQPVGDGTFTYEIQAHHDGVELLNTTGEIVLDTVVPAIAAITSPVDDEIVFNLVPILGDLQDNEGIHYFSLEYGQGSSPSEWTEFHSGSSMPGYLGTWDSKPVPNTITYTNGPYTIRLTAYDFAGNMSQDTVFVNLFNIYITDVSRLNSTIDVSQGETSQINFTILSPADVTLKIYPEWEGTQGQLVKAITNNFAAAGSYSLSWNGTDESSSLVPDEAYIYVLEAIDSSGRTDVYNPADGHINSQFSGTIDPVYDVFQNDFWNMLLTSSDPVRIKMQVTPSGGSSFYVFENRPYEAGDHLIIWDGRDPAGNIITGQSQINFGTALTLRPNYIITKGFYPQVGGSGDSIGIASDPYVTTICYGQFFKILYNLGAQCSVTVKILPPGINSLDDPESIEILSNELQDAGDHEVAWDALDPLDTSEKKMLIAEDGPFTFVIQAIDSQTNGITLKRGVINLYQ